MDHQQFLTTVAPLADDDLETAERASEIVLTVLGEHLTRGEAADVVRRLPAELQAYAWSPGNPQRFPPEEFLRRVADREGVDLLAAERHARAVFAALRAAIGPDEYADVRAQLGKDYAALLDGETSVPSLDAILDAVAAEAGVDREAARSLTEAVLETLAERIAPGDADDLAARLPVALHPPLHRGRDAGQASRRMGPAEFVSRVAQRADISLEEAAHRIPAVFIVLRPLVGDEFFDITVQLPDGYRPLLGAARPREEERA
jgi:uncharacterized protein (DUF2267 family)